MLSRILQVSEIYVCIKTIATYVQCTRLMFELFKSMNCFMDLFSFFIKFKESCLISYGIRTILVSVPLVYPHECFKLSFNQKLFFLKITRKCTFGKILIDNFPTTICFKTPPHYIYFFNFSSMSSQFFWSIAQDINYTSCTVNSMTR